MINLKPIVKEILKPTITVVGVGGAGGNAVNNMITSKLEGATFIAANTDAQALEHSLADYKIQLGLNLTQGLGAGATPAIGAGAAEEAEAEISEYLEGSNMVFVTAGMGGGTGTGASPVIASIAKQKNILTVGVVTKPFAFEGKHRMDLAIQGIEELQRYVDTLIVIPNQNLFRLANEKTTFADAFKMADDVLHSGVRGVTDLMVMPGLINLDFADIRTVMSEMGKAMMGTGESTGERRAVEAAEAAISNPLLDDVSMRGAKGVLINITGGADMTLYEVDEAANRIREEVDNDANIIFGSTFNDQLEGTMRVSVVATGIDEELARRDENFKAGFQQASKPNIVRPTTTNTAATNTATAPRQANPAQNTAAVSPRQEAPTANVAHANQQVQKNYFDDQNPNTNVSRPAQVAQPTQTTANQGVSQQHGQQVNPNAGHAGDNYGYGQKKPSFFNKITGGAFGFSKEEEQTHKTDPQVQAGGQSPEQQQMQFGGSQDLAAQQQAAAESASKEKVLAGDEDYFEIPAFLRNTKNN